MTTLDIASNFDRISELPESALMEAISQLHLNPKADASLARTGVITVGDLIRSVGNLSVMLGNTAGQAIIQILNDLHCSLDVEGSVDWLLFWQRRNILIIPSLYATATASSQIVDDLPLTFEKILQYESGRAHQEDRRWTIIQHRFGLNGSPKLTLGDLGDAFGITRERIRQIEKQAISQLRNALFEQQYAGKTYHVHPSVLDTVQLVCNATVNGQNQASIESVMLTRVCEALGVNLSEFSPALLLVFELAGYMRITFDDPDLEPVWGYIEKNQRALLEQALPLIHQILAQRTVQPLREIELLVRLNKQAPKGHKITLSQIQWLVNLCSTIEHRDDGTFWCKFQFLEGRGNQVERILAEVGQPLGFRELSRDINHRLVQHGKDKVELLNLRNQMGNDGRFIPVGNSGQWGLKSWTHVETRKITDLMQECLTVMNAPAIAEEIHAYVVERRPAKIGSITMYLHNEKEFVKTDRTRWGLVTWAEAQNASTWNPEQVATFIAGVFKEHRVKEMEFKTLGHILAEAIGVTDKQARGYLARNPVVKTRVGNKWDERFAVFQPDYKDLLSNRPTVYTRVTLRKQVAEAVRLMLETRSANEMPLADLIAALMAQFHRPKPTFYLYVSQLDFVETVDVPDSQMKLCRLKGVIGRLPFIAAQQISTTSLRQAVERAVRKLTEDDVDLGLFLLSKEFEATLRRHLTAANAQGKIVSNLGKDPEKWKLVNMVDTAKQNQIIQDGGAFQYLREQRNDRAHGAMPTLEERRLMLQSASHFSEMYVGYIRILDDLYMQL